MPKSSREVAERWSRNIGAASQAITAGVDAVTIAPTHKAAAAVDRQVEGVIRARDSGKTRRKLEAVSLTDWKTAMKTKGIPRIATGAAQAIPQMQKFMDALLPYVEQGKRMLESMPRGDENQNRQRMMAWFDHMKQMEYDRG